MCNFNAFAFHKKVTLGLTPILMNRLGIFSTTPFKTLGIQYLRGILDTYGNLNQPEANLAYYYEIIEIEKKSPDLINLLKSEVWLFSKQPLSLKLLSEEEFRKLLKKWLFEVKLCPSSKQEREVNFISSLIKEITQFEKISLIEGRSDDFETVYLELGIYYDYLVLENQSSLYVLCFIQRD